MRDEENDRIKEEGRKMREKMEEEKRQKESHRRKETRVIDSTVGGSEDEPPELGTNLLFRFSLHELRLTPCRASRPS